MKRLLSAVAVAAVMGTSLPAFGSDLRSMIDAAADAQGISRALAHAVVKIESNYNCALRGSAGERGIMQVKPATAHAVGVTGNLFDCSTGIRAGMAYLRVAISRGGPGCAGVSLYQRGVYARPNCTAYGRKVMRAFAAYH
ncbi:soluble lytic murein transglycosylase-like protein [Bradyrhizobium sp. IAR9]|uniref:transglycosylase SLT domain-containing protein n=1 Tax=Bradyrhizobium sp. IAR9 TaxID=2663841 RepID=UPI0015CBAEC4|nr:transglycosylase SLT domain-containing protein [Bradyrhizobium sp. IAR9]NYG46399.1 soluble lytic murein transglycosylase-like protein [Bradyrhizobium sp. IAR9]